MFSNEARWIAEYFAGHSNEAIGTVLNIGSSTADYRKRKQPFIDEQIFRPLAQRGVPVIHSDVKADDGVDVVADIMNDSDLERLRGLEAKTIICSNMLEHVPAPAPMAARLASLVPPGGVILVTVPNSFPYHPDPIDTLLRPDTSQLGGLFAQLRMLEGSIVEGPTASQEMMKHPWLLPRRVARSLLPFPRFGSWLSALDWWRWLFRHYKATCVVLSRPLATEATR
jgi:SAM-dependent methyltransferase